MTTAEFMTERGCERSIIGVYMRPHVSKRLQEVLTEDQAKWIHQLYIEGQIEALRMLPLKTPGHDDLIAWWEKELAALTKELEEITEGKS